MGLKCKVTYADNGSAIVTDGSGNLSSLYQRALQLVGNQDKALDMWATAYSEDFRERGEDVSLEELMKHFEANLAQDNALSPSERLQVQQYMTRNGIEYLSELSAIMDRIFRPDGRFDPDINAAKSSGLFTQDEIRDMNLPKTIKLLAKIDGHLSIEDFRVETDSQENFYTHETNKDIFGAAERISQEEINDEIKTLVAQSQNESDLYNALRKLPYQGIADRFEQDTEFADQLMGNLSKMKSVPTVSIREGQLSASNNYHYTTLKNTVLTGANTTELESDLKFLIGIDPEVWHNNHDLVEKTLKGIEKTLIKYNVDAIGISEKVHFRDDIIDLIGGVVDMLNQPSEVTINNVAARLEALVPQPPSTTNYSLDPKYSGYNIVEMHTNLSEGRLFNEHGLIKIGPNLYHKVDQQTNLNDVKEVLYNRIKDGTMELPSELQAYDSVDNKPQVLESITNYLASKKGPKGLGNSELYSALQEVFNHTPIQESKAENTKYLRNIKYSENYLKTSFISDFHKYTLEEKQKNSPLYRDVLSKFRITDADIVLTGRLYSIEGIKYEEELSDYIALKRDSSMNHLLIRDNHAISEDLLAVNQPETVPEYNEMAVLDNGYVITNSNSNNFIKFNGELYRKALSRDGAELYAKIVSTPDAVYYTNNTNFEFDKSDAKTILEKYDDFNTKSVSEKEFEQTVEKAGTSTTVRSEVSSKEVRFQVVQPTFASNALAGIEKINQKSATPQQWMKMIAEKGGKGTSQELDWIGLEDYLTEYLKENSVKSIPHGVVQDFILANELRIEEVVKESAAETEYSGYVLDGGTNYREILLTNKGGRDIVENYNQVFEESENFLMEVSFPPTDEESAKAKEFEDQLEDLKELLPPGTTFNRGLAFAPEAYKSSHWAEKDILAHIRMNDRNLPNGEKVLFVEEVQSDWAQEIKREGVQPRQAELDKASTEYRSIERELGIFQEETSEEWQKLRAQREVGAITEEGSARLLEINAVGSEIGRRLSESRRKRDDLRKRMDEGLPDMPYKKTDQWVGMAMRRVLKMAADGGYSRVAWVTGEQSADRYDLSNTVDKITSEPLGEEGRKSIFIQMKNNSDATLFVGNDGKVQQVAGAVPSDSVGKGLSEVIGKELSDRVLKAEGESTFEGEGLQVGGEGMKAFYNNILPKVVAKEAKRFDKSAKIEVVEFESTAYDVQIDEIPMDDGEVVYELYVAGDLVESVLKSELDDMADTDSLFTTGGTKTGITAKKYFEDSFPEYFEDKGNIGKQLSIKITDTLMDKLYDPVPLFQARSETNTVKSSSLNTIVDRLMVTGLADNVEIVDNKSMREEVSKYGKVKVTPTGFVREDTVYLNRDRVGLDTPIHEFGHLWNSWAKTNMPEHYAKGLELMQKDGKYYIDKVKALQKDLTGEALLEEALAQAIGEQGQYMLKKAGFLGWLSDMWESLKGALGISNVTKEQLSRMSLQEFTQAVATDLLAGEQLVEPVNVEHYSTILDSRIELLPLYSEQESITIDKQIDTCG